MKPEIRDLWVEALRSGKYKQGFGYLRDSQDYFCCLGVLTELAVERNIQEAPIYSKDRGRWLYDYGKAITITSSVPLNVCEWAGLHANKPGYNNALGRINALDGYGLYECNDELRLTFSQIADLIEYFGDEL